MNTEREKDSQEAWADEVADGDRFEFGENWKRFLRTLTEERIQNAESSFNQMLELENLQGKKFLDAGSGSGLSSLVAHRAGAKVVSFDFDASSVGCTEAVREKYGSSQPGWEVLEGSVLDSELVKNLGQFDVVYSWGVLHHTGAMWQGLENVAKAVKEGGFLFISLYNDQGGKSAFWKALKRMYCKNAFSKYISIAIGFPLLMVNPLLSSIFQRRNLFRSYSKKRGMSVYHDWHDWLGGYPFEVASPGEVLDACRVAGFELIKLRTTNGHGTNEFVFRRSMCDS